MAFSSARRLNSASFAPGAHEVAGTRLAPKIWIRSTKATFRNSAMKYQTSSNLDDLW
jgi:hypothetical protein